jgi:hypothetical protein
VTRNSLCENSGGIIAPISKIVNKLYRQENQPFVEDRERITESNRALPLMELQVSKNSK